MTIHSPPSAAASSTGGCPGSIRHERKQWGQPLAPWNRLLEWLNLNQLRTKKKVGELPRHITEFNSPLPMVRLRHSPLSTTPAEQQGDGWQTDSCGELDTLHRCTLSQKHRFSAALFFLLLTPHAAPRHMMLQHLPSPLLLYECSR